MGVLMDDDGLCARELARCLLKVADGLGTLLHESRRGAALTNQCNIKSPALPRVTVRQSKKAY